MRANTVEDNVFLFSKPSYDEVKNALQSSHHFMFISLSEMDSVDDKGKSKRRGLKVVKEGTDFFITLIDEKPIKTTYATIGQASKTLHRFANYEPTWDEVCTWEECPSKSESVLQLIWSISKLIALIIVVYSIGSIIYTHYFKEESKPVSYLNQSEFTESVKNFADAYVKSYQFENELSATKIREKRKKYLQGVPKNFKDLNVIFVSASTDSIGGAQLVFKDAYANIFYVANLKSDSKLGDYMAGKKFMTRFFISGHFDTSPLNSDFIDENSLTEKGAMIAPEFTVIINAISQ